MDSFRKHANRLKEQVTKQQQFQAVARQFSSLHGYGSSQDASNATVVIDEAELQRHQQLERLYNSTRVAKHFQRDLVKGTEGIILYGRRQMDAVNKICDESRTYASDSLGTKALLGKALLHYGTNRARIETEKEIMFNTFTTQVVEPLKAMVNGASLEDARHLQQQYERMRQDAETQAGELGRRQARGAASGENVMKLQIAEARMQELASSMALLGKEAAAALTAVESQQQRLTFQRLITWIEAEKAYHRHASEILDHVQAEIMLERQAYDSMLPFAQTKHSVIETIMKVPENEDGGDESFGNSIDKSVKNTMYLAEVIHAFEAESENELCLSVGDIVVVRQVALSGWSEGECKGRGGWFPSAYVMRKSNI